MVILNAQLSGPSPQTFDPPVSGPATTTTQHLEPLSKERQRAMEYAAMLRAYPVEGVESLRRQRAESQALERQRRMNPTGEFDAQLQLKGTDADGADDHEGDIEAMQTRPTEATAAVSPPPHLSWATWQALQAANHVAATALPLPLSPENMVHPVNDDPSSESSRSGGDVESIAYLEVDAVDQAGDLDAMSRVERERFYSSISNSSRWCFSETFTDILVDDDADGGDDDEHDTAAGHRRHDTDGTAGAVPARARFYSEASSSWVWSGSDEDDDEGDEAGRQAEQPSGPPQSSSSSSASCSGDSESDSRDGELSLPFSMSWSSHG
eukprot:gene986-709_t